MRRGVTAQRRTDGGSTRAFGEWRQRLSGEGEGKETDSGGGDCLGQSVEGTAAARSLTIADVVAGLEESGGGVSIHPPAWGNDDDDGAFPSAGPAGSWPGLPGDDNRPPRDGQVSSTRQFNRCSINTEQNSALCFQKQSGGRCGL